MEKGHENHRKKDVNRKKMTEKENSSQWWLDDTNMNEYIEGIIVNLKEFYKDKKESVKVFYIDSLVVESFMRGVSNTSDHNGGDLLRKIKMKTKDDLRAMAESRLGVFLLNDRFHWSVLIYPGRDNDGEFEKPAPMSDPMPHKPRVIELYHYDSKKDYHTNYAEMLIEGMNDLLDQTNDERSLYRFQLMKPMISVKQKDEWECGYYALVSVAGAAKQVKQGFYKPTLIPNTNIYIGMIDIDKLRDDIQGNIKMKNSIMKKIKS